MIFHSNSFYSITLFFLKLYTNTIPNERACKKYNLMLGMEENIFER